MSDIHTDAACWNDILIAGSELPLPNAWYPITSPPPPGLPGYNHMAKINMTFLRSQPEFEHWSNPDFGAEVENQDLDLLRSGRIPMVGLFQRGPKCPIWYEGLREAEKVKAEDVREKMTMGAQQENEQTWRPRVVDIDREIETCEANIAEMRMEIEELEIEIKWSEDEHAKLKKRLKLHQESKRASKPVGAPNFTLSQQIIRPDGQPASTNPKDFHIENAAEKLADCVYNHEHEIDSSELREHIRRIANEIRLAHSKHANDENIEDKVYELAIQLQKHEDERLRKKVVSHINSKNSSNELCNEPCNEPCNAGIKKASDEYIRFLFDPEHRLDHRGLEEHITKLAEEIHNQYPSRKTADIEARLWDEAIKIREDDELYTMIREMDQTTIGTNRESYLGPNRRAPSVIGARSQKQQTGGFLSTKRGYEQPRTLKHISDARPVSLLSGTEARCAAGPGPSTLAHRSRNLTSANSLTTDPCTSDDPSSDVFSTAHQERMRHLERTEHTQRMAQAARAAEAEAEPGRSDASPTPVELEQLRRDAEDVERLARGLRAEYEEALRRG
jgi:hypothetical protein